MVKKTIHTGIVLCMVLILAGCGDSAPSPASDTFATEVEANYDPPLISVFAGDMEIEWVVGLNKWSGAIFDRLDNFQWIMSDTTFDDLPIVSNGETIGIQFLGDVPDEYTLTEFILRNTGDMRFNVPGMEYAISFDNEGFGAFTIEPNIATALSSYSGDYEPGNTIKGYRLVVRWGENECEYAFIIRGDAFTSIDVEPIVHVTIEEWYGDADDALEPIYEDNLYRYYLSSIRSHLIMLTFIDGQRLSLNDALYQNKVSMDELISNGLQVSRERISPEAFASDSSYEVGRVWLVSGDTEYEPGEHFLHGATHTEHGQLSASGIPFDFWLENNLNDLPEIQYVPGLQIVIDGEHGRIVTFQQQYPVYYEGYRQIGIPADNFIDGIGTVSLPLDSGTYLVYADVTWSGGGSEFTRIRYIFKIAREFELVDIPERSPSLYVDINAEGLEPQRIRAAQGTTSWSPAFAFADRFQIGDVITGGYEASGEHPLDFWRETWECIDFSAFKADLSGADNEVVISLDFDFPPTSIQVKRWSTEYIGMASEMWNDYEPVEVTGNTVRIHNDGNDYIYAVTASWTRGENSFGRAMYTFRLNAGREQSRLLRIDASETYSIR